MEQLVVLDGGKMDLAVLLALVEDPPARLFSIQSLQHKKAGGGRTAVIGGVFDGGAFEGVLCENRGCPRNSLCGWTVEAAIFALTWCGLLRIGNIREVLSALESDLVLLEESARIRLIIRTLFSIQPGSLVLFVLALLTSRPMLKAEAEEAEHALDLWDEEIIKQQHSKEKSSCGYYGCQQSRGVCSCHHGCIMEGTCCADYRELCQVSDRAHAKSGPGASRGRCAELGCSRAYRYDQPCQCVPSCLDFDDCCDDFRSHCGANVSMSLEVAPSKDEEPKIKASFIPSAAVSADSKEKHKAFLKNHAARLELVKWQAVRSCPPQFMEKTILGGKQMQKLANISTAAECQKVCTLNVQCDGFVWAMNGACSLESLDGAAPNMMVQEGLISGLPCCRPKPAHTKVIPDCPELVLDMELSRAQGLREQEAKSAYACQQACSKATDCGAFSWTATTKRCSMKKLASDESAKMVPKAGVITGLPCGCRATVANALWPDSDEEKFTMPLPRGSQPVELGSLLCLALMLPYSYEAGLLIMQYKEHAGIFDCDEYTVYSSESMVLAPGLETRKVLTSQQCEVGGEFKSALNLRIFASFWRQVIADGQYLLYNWIVKVDPDSVFFPQRLRPILQRHEGGSMSTGGPGELGCATSLDTDKRYLLQQLQVWHAWPVGSLLLGHHPRTGHQLPRLL
ncbi:unnamed protein product [Durusdinium trenchii]|uniref:Uncharacterized protein n=1 Tax=Durusdinium trenchii TaxID=1381693 RepID=A0ABP0IRF6_9DINO